LIGEKLACSNRVLVRATFVLGEGDDAIATGDGEVASGLGSDPSASSGCACTLPRDERRGNSLSLTAAALALLGLRRHSSGARARR
jgi:hypothetical protein